MGRARLLLSRGELTAEALLCSAPRRGASRMLLLLLLLGSASTCAEDLEAGECQAAAGREQVLMQTTSASRKRMRAAVAVVDDDAVNGTAEFSGAPLEESGDHTVLLQHSRSKIRATGPKAAARILSMAEAKAPALYADSGAGPVVLSGDSSRLRRDAALLVAVAAVAALVGLYMFREPSVPPPPPPWTPDQEAHANEGIGGRRERRRATTLPQLKKSVLVSRQEDEEDTASPASSVSPTMADLPRFDLLAPANADYSLNIPVCNLDGGPFSVADEKGNPVLLVTPRGPSACRSPHMRQLAHGGSSSPAAASPVMARTQSLPSRPTTGRPPPVDLWRLLLASAQDGGGVLAQCYATGSGAKTEFHIQRGDGSPWAKLTPGSSEHDYRFVLKVADGSEYVYRGDYVDSTMTITNMKVTNSFGKTVATTFQYEGGGGESTPSAGAGGGAGGAAAEDGGPASFYKLRARPLTDVGLLLCGVFCIQWHIASAFS